MTTLPTLLRKQLGKATQGEDFVRLGFRSLRKTLQDVAGDNDLFERLWVWENEEGVRIVVLDEGNDNWCTVGLYDEVVYEKKGFNDLSHTVFGGDVFRSMKEVGEEVDAFFENGEFQ